MPGRGTLQPGEITGEEQGVLAGDEKLIEARTEFVARAVGAGDVRRAGVDLRFARHKKIAPLHEAAECRRRGDRQRPRADEVEQVLKIDLRRQADAAVLPG
ncbi:MAG: hypothetical protein ACK56I_14175, partial [bacterium]